MLASSRNEYCVPGIPQEMSIVSPEFPGIPEFPPAGQLSLRAGEHPHHNQQVGEGLARDPGRRRGDGNGAA